MRKVILILFVLQSILLEYNAQIQIIGEADESAFPLIEFVMHNRNPEVLGINNFQFFENVEGESIKIDSLTFETIEDTLDYSKENKCLLIMIEALHHKDRYEQVNTFISALNNSIDAIVNNGDKVKIVAFSLRDGTPNILENVTSEFTDNIDAIKRELDAYKVDKNYFNKHPVSDIMGALDEGIEQLIEQDNSLPKSILLLSEERKNTHATLTANDVTERAKTKNIVINTIKYNRSYYNQYLEPTLSKETYGISKVLSKSLGTSINGDSEKTIEAQDAIAEILTNCIERQAGKKYLLSFTATSNIKDGKSQEILIKQVDSKFKTTFNFKAPGNWLRAQFQKHLYLSIGATLLVLLLIVLLILFLVKKKRKKAALLSKIKAKQIKTDLEQNEKINKQNEELLSIKNKEKQKLIYENKIKEEERKKEQEKELISQMKLMGPFPILKYSDSSETLKFEINKPLITVGRDKSSNVICIPNNKISKNHFNIVFLNNEYKIIDNNSTNGIKINGYNTKEAILNNGDIIDIADVSFTFYK